MELKYSKQQIERVLNLVNSIPGHGIQYSMIIVEIFNILESVIKNQNQNIKTDNIAEKENKSKENIKTD